MENYDVKIHIGQQIENFLNGYASADAGVMERVKKNLLDVMKNSDLKNSAVSIRSWDDKKQAEIRKIWDKANDAIKLVANTKKDEQLFIDIDEIKKDTVDALNLLESEYWDSIRELVLKSVNQDETTG